MIAALTGAPRWVQALAGLAFAAAVALLWLHFHGRGVIADHEAALAPKVQASASAAASAAADAVTVATTETERTNDEARRAAAGSDDPLRAGLDRLRTGTGAADPAAR